MLGHQRAEDGAQAFVCGGEVVVHLDARAAAAGRGQEHHGPVAAAGHLDRGRFSAPEARVAPDGPLDGQRPLEQAVLDVLSQKFGDGSARTPALHAHDGALGRDVSALQVRAGDMANLVRELAAVLAQRVDDRLARMHDDDDELHARAAATSGASFKRAVTASETWPRSITHANPSASACLAGRGA